MRIYGAYNSNKESLAKIINLLPGEKLDVAKLRMIEDNLNATGSFSQAAVACQEEKDGEVIVKIVVKESFLFFLDPYDAGFTMVNDISNQTLTMKLFNLGGEFINLSGFASLPDLKSFEVNFSKPFVLNNTYQYQENLSLGSYSQAYG